MLNLYRKFFNPGKIRQRRILRKSFASAELFFINKYLRLPGAGGTRYHQSIVGYGLQKMYRSSERCVSQYEKEYRRRDLFYV